MNKIFIIIIIHLYTIILMEYNIHAILCDCEYSSEYVIISEKCNHCTKRESIPWYIEVKTIDKYIRLIEKTSDMPKKLLNTRQLFEYLLTCPTFIAKNPNFRRAVISKINEYKCDDVCISLIDIFDKVSLFINNLATIEGYIE